MISKGQIRIPGSKDEGWKAHTRKAINTVGWAILEMYREPQGVREKAKEEPEKRTELRRIVGRDKNSIIGQR